MKDSLNGFNLQSIISNYDLQTIGRTKQFQPNEVVYDSDVDITVIPFLISGSLKVFRSNDDGKEILLYYLSPGETCIMSLLKESADVDTIIRVEAEEISDVVIIPVEELAHLMKESPEMLAYIFNLYNKRFKELLQVVESVSFKKMDERLLDLLTKKSQLKKSQEISITHEQLANELGTARVVVSRLLKQMETQGIAVLGRNSIRLVQH